MSVDTWGRPVAEHYELQVEKLKELEQLSLYGAIDLAIPRMNPMYAAKATLPTDGNSRMKRFVSCLKKPINLSSR